MNLGDIDNTTKEGRMLMMALASLTVSPNIRLNGKKRDGRKMTPDMVIKELEKLMNEVYDQEHS